MKLKNCRECKENKPLSAFTSTRAKYCNQCKLIVRLKQQKEAQNRAFSRLQNKKQKKQVVTSISTLKKTAQKLVNKLARLRDQKDGCISCTTGKSEQGGHFWAMGSKSALRYNLLNINGQCTQCNFRKRGNPLEYRIRLVEKIGEDQVKWLDEHRNDVKSWTREELEQIIVETKELLKQYDK